MEPLEDVAEKVIVSDRSDFAFQNLSTVATSLVSDITNSSSGWNSSALENLLAIKMGPRQANLTWSLTTLYGTIFLLGLFGNLCICIVIIRVRHMHSTTNFYLLSLAISDILILVIGLPSEIYGIWRAYPWPFGIIYCFFKSMMLEVTSYASVLTITAFTVERYIAICHPLRAHTVSNLNRTLKVILAIWIISILVSLPYALYTKLIYRVNNPETGEPLTDSLQCTIAIEFLDGMIIMFQISTFLFFVTPLFVLIVLYTLIAITINRAIIQRSSHNQTRLTSIPMISGSGSGRNYLSSNRRRKAVKNTQGSVLKLLVAVVVAFFLCWAPFHIQRLLTLYISNWTPSLLQINLYLFYISGILYFLHSAINPVLYHIMSEKFKSAFLQTFFCRRGKAAQQRLNSVVTQHTGLQPPNQYLQNKRRNMTVGESPV